MLTADQTITPPRRTAFGALWRCLATVLICLAGTAAGAWLGSKVCGYDGRLVTAPTAPPAIAIGLLAAFWLRARNGFIAAPILGTLVAAQGGAYLLNDGILAGGRLHLAVSGLTKFELIVASAGLLAALLGIVCAAVSGHRRPRPQDEAPVPTSEKS